MPQSECMFSLLWIAGALTFAPDLVLIPAIALLVYTTCWCHRRVSDLCQRIAFHRSKWRPLSDQCFSRLSVFFSLIPFFFLFPFFLPSLSLSPSLSVSVAPPVFFSFQKKTCTKGRKTRNSCV